MSIALFFPGQGSQFVGMGKEDYENNSIVKDLYDRAETVTGMKIKEVSFNDPHKLLNRTDFTQVAIFVHSCAMFKLIEGKINFSAVAGHSLGEYSALYASEVLGFEDCLQAVKKRGELMVKVKGGGMLAVIGAKVEDVENIVEELAEGGVITIANYNSPIQLVLSGEVSLLKLAEAKLRETSAKKVVWLPVSGAFHSAMMEKPQDSLIKVLSKFRFNTPHCKYYSNVTGSDLDDPKEIKKLLGLQLTSSVLWYRIVQALWDDGVDTFIEVGPNKVLSGLVKRICSSARLFNVQDEKDIDNLPDDILHV